MQQPVHNYPKARQRGVLVEHVGDETVVFDEERKSAHSLNRSASLVWRHCDGEHSVQQLAAILEPELGADDAQPVVDYAIEELSRAHLLEASPNGQANAVSRRDAIRKMSFAGAAAIALPVVMSIAAPTPAMAASGEQPPPDPGEDF